MMGVVLMLSSSSGEIDGFRRGFDNETGKLPSRVFYTMLN